MTLFSSSGGTIEGLMDRVSDITMSPVILRDIWQNFYRQIRLICLVCFAFFPIVSFGYDRSFLSNQDKVTRSEFIYGVYTELFSEVPNEETVKKLGILDPFQDNQMHMDWPITRGIAADAFYRISLQTASINKLPRAFADIPEYSELAKILEVVGGAFLPRNQGKFEPDKLLTPRHFQHAVSLLIRKEIIKPAKSVQLDSLPVYQSTQSKFANIKPIKPELGFNEKPHSNYKFVTNSLNNIEKINNMKISSQQMNPQEVSNINEALQAMQEARTYLEKFGSSVFELTELEVTNEGDELALSDTLKQFSQMLSDFEFRFKLCKEQLERVTIVDPKQIQKCSLLNDGLNEGLNEIKILQKKIRERLNVSAIFTH